MKAAEALHEGNGLFSHFGALGLSARGVVLVDVGQLGFVDPAALLGLLVHEGPEEHPDEAQAADDDEGPFPAELHGEGRNQERSGQRSHGGAGVEDGGREGAVLLREIFSRHLDGGREVAGFAEGEDAPAEEEQVDGGRRYGERDVAAHFEGGEGLRPVQAGQEGGAPAAQGVQACAERPDADGDEVAFLRAHPVHEFAGEQAADR